MITQQAITELEKISSEVRHLFGNLSVEQLNWKPSPDKWSISQCLDHLIVSNSSYYPQLKEVVSGVHRNSFYQNIGFISRFCADYLIKETGPVVNKPQKNPPVWTPSLSNIPLTIVADFIKQQQEFSLLIEQLNKTNLQKTIISSPALSAITYNLKDLLTIIVGHEQRHLQQAKNVLKYKEFPE